MDFLASIKRKNEPQKDSTHFNLAWVVSSCSLLGLAWNPDFRV